MPLFSVIVPIYKVEAYLGECIDSILAQTYDDFELILVNDGSPDNCGRICDEYAEKDNRIHVIHKENGGVVSARQAGAEAATGRYIACVDGDDWIAPEYLERFADVIHRYDADIVCCGYNSAFPDRMVSVPFKLSSGLYSRERMEREIFPVLLYGVEYLGFAQILCSKVIKQRIFLQHHSQLDTHINLGEDGAVCRACVFSSNSLYIMSECLYFYRQNPHSVTKTTKVFDMSMPRKLALYWEKQIDLTQFDLQAQLYRRVVHDLFYDATTQFNRKEPFSVIIRDIKAQLDEPYYRKAINQCCFRGNWKGTLAKAALKYRLYGVLWLYSCLK